MSRRRPTWLALLLLATPAVGQQSSFSTAESMRLRQEPEPTPEEPREELVRERPEPARGGPPRSIELALSSDAYWVGFRTPVRDGLGHVELGLLGDEDDDLALTARLIRYGRPVQESPLLLGVGVAGYVATFDVPVSADAFAIGLTGSASYELPTAWPTSLGVDLSFAPGVTTWSDGEDLIDLRLRAEVELSPYAAAFVGYRKLEVDLGKDGDAEVDARVHVGVRLAF